MGSRSVLAEFEQVHGGSSVAQAGCSSVHTVRKEESRKGPGSSAMTEPER